MPNNIAKYAPQVFVSGLQQQHQAARDKQQTAMERSMAGGDALEVESEPKPHGPVKALPWSLRAKQALRAAHNYVPSTEELRAYAWSMIKFAGIAPPVALVGMGIGALSHGMLLDPYRDTLGIKTPVDPHRGATVGIVAGVTCAGALALKRYDLAGAVGAAVGGGLVAQALGLLIGIITAGALLGLSETANAYRWYVGAPVQVGQSFATCAMAVPVLQVAGGLAGAGAAGYFTYEALRDTPVEETSNV